MKKPKWFCFFVGVRINGFTSANENVPLWYFKFRLKSVQGTLNITGHKCAALGFLLTYIVLATLFKTLCQTAFSCTFCHVSVLFDLWPSTEFRSLDLFVLLCPVVFNSRAHLMIAPIDLHRSELCTSFVPYACNPLIDLHWPNLTGPSTVWHCTCQLTTARWPCFRAFISMWSICVQA